MRQQIGQVNVARQGFDRCRESDAVEMTARCRAARAAAERAAEPTSLAEEAGGKIFLAQPPGRRAPAGALRCASRHRPLSPARCFGALDYLTSYPYGCTEQTMSSFLPNVIVAQTLQE